MLTDGQAVGWSSSGRSGDVRIRGEEYPARIRVRVGDQAVRNVTRCPDPGRRTRRRHPCACGRSGGAKPHVMSGSGTKNTPPASAYVRKIRRCETSRNVRIRGEEDPAGIRVRVGDQAVRNVTRCPDPGRRTRRRHPCTCGRSGGAKPHVMSGSGTKNTPPASVYVWEIRASCSSRRRWVMMNVAGSLKNARNSSPAPGVSPSG